MSVSDVVPSDHNASPLLSSPLFLSHFISALDGGQRMDKHAINQLQMEIEIKTKMETVHAMTSAPLHLTPSSPFNPFVSSLPPSYYPPTILFFSLLFYPSLPFPLLSLHIKSLHPSSILSTHSLSLPLLYKSVAMA